MDTSSEYFHRVLARQFGEAAAEWLGKGLEQVVLSGGDWLFHQGDDSDALFFLVRGRLEVLAGPANKRRLLGEIRPGDSVGEGGLLSGAARSAGARAVRESVLIRLNRAQFHALAARHPGVLMAMTGRLAKLMQLSVDSTQTVARSHSTLCLLQVDDGERVSQAVDQLTNRLDEDARTLVLAPGRLDALGAPAFDPEGHQNEPLRHWLAQREEARHRLVFLGDTSNSAWADFAVKQSDLTCLMVDAEGAPRIGPFEESIAPSGRTVLVLHHAPDTEITGTLGWLTPRQVDFHLHLRTDQPQDIDRIVRVLRDEATGVVFGSGAVRGLAGLGVYRAMVELGINVDWVGGSSMGSVVAGGPARDWDPETATARARESFVGKRPFSDYTIPMVSMLSGRRMAREVGRHLDVEIEDLPIPYFCVSSILDRGEIHVHERGNLVKAIRTSSALPGVFPPMVVDGEIAVDGAVMNSLPVDVMRQKPVHRVIAVDFTCPQDISVDPSGVPSGWSALSSRLLPFRAPSRFPVVAGLLSRAVEIGTLAQTRSRRAAADLVIRPDLARFDMTDVSAFDDIVQEGYESARAEISAWLDRDSGASP